MKEKLKFILAFFSFVVPTLIIGFAYKYGVFKSEYEQLQMYREDISMPFAFASLFIQAGFWTFISHKIFIKDKYWMRTIKLFMLMFSLGLSFNVFVIGAKHVITSLYNFFLLETGFTLLMYSVICPLITLSFYDKEKEKSKL